MSKNFSTADEAFADACREWLKGCSCSPPGKPHKCKDCTKAFLKAVRQRAKRFDVPTSANTLRGVDPRPIITRTLEARRDPPETVHVTFLDVHNDAAISQDEALDQTTRLWFDARRAEGIKAVVDINYVNTNSFTLDMTNCPLTDNPQVGDDVLLINALQGLDGWQMRVKLISKATQRDGSIRWGYCPVSSIDTSK